jgi:hypothetical protein
VRWTCVVIDYADELSSDNPKDRDAYTSMKTVYRGLEAIAKNDGQKHQRWVHTASQAKRLVRGQKVVTGDDIADSINKMRVLDLAVSVMLADDQSTVDFFVAKNRLGSGKQLVTGLPVELECGRIGPVTHVR